MDFHFDADQRAFANSAQSLFADHCSDTQLRDHDAAGAPFMESLWPLCVLGGLHSIVLAERDGGLGLGMTDLMAVLEQQGAALALVPLAEHQLAAGALARFAPALQQRVLQAAAGECMLTLSLDGTRDALGLRLRARLGQDGLRVDGVAAAVPLGAQAQFALLPVDLDGCPRLLLLDLDAAGLRRVEGTSQHRLRLADLHCDGVRVPLASLLADGAQEWLEPRLVAAAAALQLGVSAQQIRRAVAYVSERQQFGRVIGSFQLVASQMADCFIALEALRSALSQLVYRLDAGLGCAAQALSVKVLAAQAAHLVGHKAQHVHGGIGVDIGYPIHRFLYWSRALGASLGGPEQALARLGSWLADNDCLGWKYDLAEDHGAVDAV